MTIYASYPGCITIASYYLIVFISHTVLSGNIDLMTHMLNHNEIKIIM